VYKYKTFFLNFVQKH